MMESVPPKITGPTVSKDMATFNPLFLTAKIGSHCACLFHGLFF